MRSRRGLIAIAALVVTACSSASEAPTTSFTRPSPGTGGSSGVTGGMSAGPATSSESPSGCPATRPSVAPAKDLTEANVRERLVGIHRSCNGGNEGLEIRLDADGARLLWSGLDSRFVRDGSTGWLDVTSCSGGSCTGQWRIDLQDETWAVDLTVWTDPVAFEVKDPAAFEGSAEWVRVAD